MGDQLVHTSISGGVARIELDKPPVNAFDLSLVQALAEAVRELALSDARLAIFSGRGPSLGAGGDIKWMYARTMARDGQALRTFFRAIQTVFDDVERLAIPTIAAVHGMTLGGGLELALACDLRIAAEDARIGFPEATIGLIPAAGGTQRLTEIVGRPRALELMSTGRVLSAGEALELGLVNRVVPADQLTAETDEFAAAVLRSTRAALRALKECVRARIEDGRAAGSRREREFAELLAFDDDAVQRLEAFHNRGRPAATKREPELQGA
jgi:enoyl-CoA hydratase/carnithine racemase